MIRTNLPFGFFEERERGPGWVSRFSQARTAFLPTIATIPTATAVAAPSATTTAAPSAVIAAPAAAALGLRSRFVDH